MRNIFDKIFKFFIVILPFYAIISVFFQYKLGIKAFGIFKEILVLILAGILLFEIIKNKKIPKFDILDYLIFGYFGYLIIISLINFSWLKAIIYWWRYDFEFFLIFLIIRHWSFLLKNKLSYYLRIFLISASISIIIWAIVRFWTWERILLHFWFSDKLSSWNIEDWPPIYHWIEWQNVRRFQWIFDWPNQAAYFIIVYLWLFFHYLRHKKNYELILIWWLFVSLGLIFMTYSRSSWLGIIWWLWIIFLLNIKKIFTKYKKEFIWILIVLFITGGAFYIRYWWNMEWIILRAWSSKWHSERMIIWIKQFKEKPLWQWLASSGPAYRLVHPTEKLVHPTEKIDEKFYIPESWFVQQLVEWGIIWFILFCLILGLISYLISQVSIGLLFSFVAVLIMNIFLHTFEASYISLILFTFLGLFLKDKWKN